MGCCMNVLINEYKLPSTMTDTYGRLGIVGALAIVQDNMCQFFRMIRCDGFIMEPQIHCFWVVTKTNIKILDNAEWLDDIQVKTYLSKKTNIRVNLTTEIRHKDDRLIAECTQEICAMGSIDRKIRLVKDTFFPLDCEVVERDFLFTKLAFADIEFDTKNCVTINSSNIDFCMHTNNLEYVKLMLDCYPIDFWRDRDIVEFDINYLSESRYADELIIQSKVINNSSCFVITKGSDIITKAQILFNK